MARALVRLSLVAAAASAAAVAGDELSLLQVDAIAARADDDACKCLSWKGVYANQTNQSLACGKGGPELDFIGGHGMKVLVSEEFCKKFYEKLSGNFCTQLYFGEQRGEQWCYVSPECQDASVVKSVGSFKWKQCKPETDTMLAEMSPEQLYELAVSENKDPSLLLKMAYPVYKKEGKHPLDWQAVKACLKKPSGHGCGGVQGVQQFGQPVIFDSKDGHPPFGVIVGSKAYETHFTPWFYATVLNQTALWSTPHKMSAYKCVHGCTI